MRNKVISDLGNGFKYHELVEFYCTKQDLSTFDPYDIWKTGLGVYVKDWFNRSKLLAGGPALAMTLYDHLLNNGLRLGYSKQEYPIVRALAAQVLLNTYNSSKNDKYLISAREHLDWLVENSSKGYSGYCWGLGFKWAVYKGVIYDSNTPHSTHTPYALEAFDMYKEITNESRYDHVIISCFEFYENDLKILCEDKDSMAISYGPFKDRPISNAVSYTLYAYSIFLKYFPEKGEYLNAKIQKFYNFIKKKQLDNGAWFYAPLESNSFIDCFHSCIILKNVFKAQRNLGCLQDSDLIIQSGYEYLKNHFFEEKIGLFKRFSKTNKLSLIKFDLYDNAEVLALSKLLVDNDVAESLQDRIFEVFVKSDKEIFSAINILGNPINKNTLRWAVMPFLYSLST
ncbi:hypothetical protein [Arthrospiribacter ruber]|uniref:Delta-aminolevulinic acid dehydratase n=1 Tax=Arthrospiribacter ruber TaxID=2487934 RepID=A0A951MD88_9BACT|nr:hypothetical protein [Arthrospiribacter ruber]MBW3468312.1 hypothetical protein [Arthrospiribacter ruber]